MSSNDRPSLLVLASTYPRWKDDYEPSFVHELSRRLTDRFRVTVLCPHARGALPREILDGVEIVRYRYAPEVVESLVNDGGIVTNLRRYPWKWLLVPAFVLGQMIAARRILSRSNFDVVHAHWLVPQGLVATLAGQVPVVVTSHGADLFALRGKAASSLRKWVASRATALTVVSRAMCAILCSEGVEEQKIAVLPMGVDFDGRFTPGDMASRAVDSLLFVGRLVEKKGLPYLLAAMPSILAKCPDAHLDIVGHGPDANELRAKAEILGVSHAVTFHGPLQQAALPELYRRATVFVAPFIAAASGDEEGLPVALSEAIACGCPAVAGNVQGLRDLVGDEEDDAWIVDPRDIGLLAARIIAVLQNPVAANARAVALRERLRGRLDWTTISDSYAQILLHATDEGAI